MGLTKETKKKTDDSEEQEAEKEPTSETTEPVTIEPVEGRRDGNGALIVN